MPVIRVLDILNAEDDAIAAEAVCGAAFVVESDRGEPLYIIHDMTEGAREDLRSLAPLLDALRAVAVRAGS